MEDPVQEPQRSRLRPERTPSGPGGTTAAQLPADLQAKARRRVAFIGFAVAGIMVVAGVASRTLLSSTNEAFLRVFEIVFAARMGILVLGIAVGVIALWARRVTDDQVVTLLFAYMVLTVLFDICADYSHVWMRYGHSPRTSFAALPMIMFPLVVPASARKTLIALVVAGAMWPLGCGLLIFADVMPLTGETMGKPTLQAIVGVVIGYLCSRVVYRISTDVARARRMGSYHLETRIGKGGMGEVWRASHRTLARPAAVKLISEEVVAEVGTSHEVATALARFKREANITANLLSPHTVSLYDYGRSESGSLYYAIELVEGQNLEDLVQQHGAQPSERVVHLLLQACHSLAEAHAKGLVHRDVKPANFMVAAERAGDYDFVKVLDFGIVSLLGEPHDAKLTAEGAVVGTPTYLSPEAILGDEPDARSDIYSLACVAYWLLTGQTVFKGKSIAEQLAGHLRDEPVPPSKRGAVGLPDDHDALILQCLAKKPLERPASVDELATRLRALAIAPLWTAERAAAWWADHAPDPQPQPKSAVDGGASTELLPMSGA